MSEEEDPDAQLLVRVGQGEAAAVREMVARKLPRLLSLAARLLGERTEAEDVAQEVFVRLWKQAPRWQTGQARVDTWLHRVALNLCYDRLRRRGTHPLEAVAEPLDTAAPPDERIASAQRSARVAQALARLPPRQREALVLQYYQELSNVAAAELMGITVEALESLLARARRNMRSYLDGDGTHDT